MAEPNRLSSGRWKVRYRDPLRRPATHGWVRYQVPTSIKSVTLRAIGNGLSTELGYDGFPARHHGPE